MLGKTLVRWLAASGRPAALADREAREQDDQALQDDQPTHAGNWLTRTIQRHRVLTASGIAVGLFAFGGIAWSARNEPRLVRKATVDDSALDDGTMFDELLNLPSIPVRNTESDAVGTNSPLPLPGSSQSDRLTNPSGDAAYDPFKQLPPSYNESNSIGNVAPTERHVTTPDVNNSPVLSTPDDSDTEFPSLGFPEFNTEPQLDDSADQAQPLLNTSNPFQSE